MYQPRSALVGEKLPCMCSRGLTFDTWLALIVPFAELRSRVPPTRPAVAVRQIPFRAVVVLGDDAPVVALIGIT